VRKEERRQLFVPGCLLVESSKMKPNTKSFETEDPAYPIQHGVLAREDGQTEQMELSPELTADGPSTATQIISEVLSEEEKRYDLRHWGINE
jgi:hypothetical protein